jgi:LysR family transcriptional regulator, nitrogen assimilation regulatory protein
LEELFYVAADPDTAPIRLAEVPQRQLLECGPGGNIRHVAETAFKQYGITVTPIAEFDTLSALRSAIASGIGNAILSWSALYEGDREILLNLQRIADAKLVRTIALCFSEVVERTSAIDAVAETLKSLARELVERGTWQGGVTDRT